MRSSDCTTRAGAAAAAAADSHSRCCKPPLFQTNSSLFLFGPSARKLDGHGGAKRVSEKPNSKNVQIAIGPCIIQRTHTRTARARRAAIGREACNRAGREELRSHGERCRNPSLQTQGQVGLRQQQQQSPAAERAEREGWRMCMFGACVRAHVSQFMTPV